MKTGDSLRALQTHSVPWVFCGHWTCASTPQSLGDASWTPQWTVAETNKKKTKKKLHISIKEVFEPIKEMVHPKKNIVLLFTHPYVVLYELCSSVEHTRGYFHNIFVPFPIQWMVNFQDSKRMQKHHKSSLFNLLYDLLYLSFLKSYDSFVWEEKFMLFIQSPDRVTLENQNNDNVK